MTTRVIGGIAGGAAVITLAVGVAIVVRAVVNVALTVHGVCLRLAVAKQDRQGRSDALQRHYRQRQHKREFLAPSGHHGAGV